MEMLIDSVKNKSYSDANNIALMLIGILFYAIHFSFFRLSLFIDFTEHTFQQLSLL
jgi:hypothetical protein